MTPGPVADLAVFADALRTRGMTVTPDQVGAMARSLSLVDAASRDQVYAALRSLSVSEPDQRKPFDEEFTRFFDRLIEPPGRADQYEKTSATPSVKPIVQGLSDRSVEDTQTQEGASATATLRTRDFAELDETELAEARRLVMAMMWQPSDVKTRRWSPSRRGSAPDLRRTLRRSTRPEGDLMPIVRRQRRRRQRPLIVIADISGSMEQYADLFLVFAHAAQRRIDDVEVFTFSTELTRITEDLRRRDTQTALARVAKTVHDWSGGTKIGEAIGTWNRLWSRRLSRGGPVALILSDGWDCGDPELLSEEMGRLSRTVHKVLWLNPLAARADYEPATRGMRAVLPHLDHLLPAASVNDLRDVVRLLDSIGVSAA
ncbi:MAG: VWA domain-containing protein [Acidimicrobiia bacterium]|jgi:uncharacterized protein with von Willebrand factor type A (vWA) domain